ncbi:hypothetical protein SKAU_G00202560 [Synaphobranchus kaupii]|uniref:Uncharacterized protein n=1 Tax=Synaphobranchus kaupii TaxID=118154 RepID=A0A9Q1FFR8_SYNKA|nr:hypothetical protein SKAU_G00202560 [Synaphobranchus kaupii]
MNIFDTPPEDGTNLLEVIVLQLEKLADQTEASQCLTEHREQDGNPRLGDCKSCLMAARCTDTVQANQSSGLTCTDSHNAPCAVLYLDLSLLLARG